MLGRSAGAQVGDKKGDLINDIIVAAYLEDPGTSPSAAGRAYLFSGADGSVLHTLVSPNEQYNGYFGRSVSGAGGDINSDGVPDVLVGAFWENPGGTPDQSGIAYAFSGADGSLLRTLISPQPISSGWFGYSVAGPGTDANGDGVPDLMVGAPQEGEDAGLNAESGRVHLYSGADGSLLQTLVSANLEPDGWFGYAISGTSGDLDGDGVLDMLVGGQRQDAGGDPTDAGQAYIFSGRGLVCNTVNPPANQQHLNLANRVQLFWQPQVLAVGCQVQGRKVPSGPQTIVNVLTPSYNTISVPYAAAGAGTTWTWRVRCACNLSPVEATPYTIYGDTFFVPVARQALVVESSIEIFPNPASDRVSIAISSAENGEKFLQVFDGLGRLMESRNQPIAAGTSRLDLDLKGYADGLYFIQLGEGEAYPFTVSH